MQDIARRCNEILELLEREVALHRDLLDLSRREQGLLVSFDTDALMTTLRDVEAVVAKTRTVMEARLALLGEVACGLGPGLDRGRGPDSGRGLVSGRGGATCEEVMSSAGEEYVERYRTILQQLAPVLEEHAVINSGNIVLINNILDYIDFAARMYAGLESRNTYSADTMAPRRKAGRPNALHFSRS
ncbi:MAG: flagellar protein FlgN [Bacillota bacterium]|nr:flagellar protein FlgN [Bacillota bacterium]